MDAIEYRCAFLASTAEADASTAVFWRKQSNQSVGCGLLCQADNETIEAIEYEFRVRVAAEQIIHLRTAQYELAKASV